MNIYDQIEQIFSNELVQKEVPTWVNDILQELQEIKFLLKQINIEKSYKNQSNNLQDYYSFVNNLRARMKADTFNNIYPYLVYEDKKYGINFEGLLYEKETNKRISSEEAFKIYKYLYEHQEELFIAS